ncbi:FtsK/SpoIIIE domain-containing protein [Bifidobacterium avesanii]|uniref:Cell division protein FtsK n=1 Tax=Bifidobacterium avesanii TaxID=1798157 RepID=A0A7K3TGY6_9BIFI|nr:FtsK/SpoIIIE domain-containing protein [Bifidobacterium avesanii]KAB8292747.1 DNA segregation ATPase and related proteins (FtsK/SpoIIIE family) [Bifidobacterium avesanii]NEG78355.1 cell division protein FtsK [Bifidobacterium avesanii]
MRIFNRPGKEPSAARDPAAPWMVMSMLAPACAQIAMAVMMVLEGRWTFAIMLLPGLFGCVASFMVMRSRQSARQPGGPPGAGDGTRAGIDADAGGTAIPDLESVPWPTLMGLPQDASQWWRAVVHRWALARQRRDDGMPGIGGLGAHAGQPAPIGMGEHGPAVMDLATHGPHALVAGTTGSGKSVLLKQWCLALAVNYPPDMLAMVFLDFKGGATFRGLEALPHAVGCVSDLDLAHAVRALNAIEAELKRRERLVAEAGGAQIDDLPAPPPRLLVMVDEFNALKEQLPDAMDRLTRLASLGRSLGMNLVACTQHPMGQVSAAMKANIAVNLCMRVRDDLQSISMLGTKAAALIPSTSPGVGYRHDGDALEAFRCARPQDALGPVRAVSDAARFCGVRPAEPLFSEPLPEYLSGSHAAADGSGAIVGAWDDGVRLHPCAIGFDGGCVAVIGGAKRGKSTLIAGLAARLAQAGVPYATAPEQADASTRVVLVDDADELADPLGGDPRRKDFERLLADGSVTVVFALSSARRLGDASRVTMRIVLPSGDRTADLLAGAPADALDRAGGDATRIPGRAVVVARGRADPVQLCDR